MSRRKQLVAAVEAGDSLAVHRLDWTEPWQALRSVAAPKQGCTLQELGAYVRFLGDEDPATVVAAIEALAGDWRPTPGAIRGYLNRRRNESTIDVGRGRDRASTADALAAVADAYRLGERECTCGYHPSTWSPDRSHVLRCRTCRGLEPGQLNQAEDAGLIEAAA